MSNTQDSIEKLIKDSKFKGFVGAKRRITTVGDI